MKNIYLIGMPGCGKTTIGKSAARRGEVDFLDIDSLIIKNENMKIEDIFKDFGEKHFRQLESSALKTISEMNNTVVSCGGGIVLDQKNIDIMKATGSIVYIDVKLYHLEKRTMKSTRPLLKDGISALRKLYYERKSIYKSVNDYCIKNNKNKGQAVDKILDIINNC